jgi:hypothetical protein
MSDTTTKETNGNESGKAERLGMIPLDKIGGVVPAKVWAEHRKNLAALAAAKEAAAISKQAVLVAISKTLKLGDPSLLDFGTDADKVRVLRRAEKKATRTTALRDLTA